jgi:hypothetical protein
MQPPSAEQAECIDALFTGTNVAVSAQAGAGKTTVFMHCATRWLAERPDAHVLIVCYNVNLRTATQLRLAQLGLSEQVHAYTVHSLAGKIFGASIGDTMTLQKYIRADGPRTLPAPFSLVLVDEGQDLTPLMLSVINVALALAPAPRVMVVGDHRQEIYGFTHGGGPHAVLASPEKCFAHCALPWRQCKLQQSFRVSAPTAAFLNRMLRHPLDDPMVGVDTPDARKPIYIIGNMANGAGIDTVIHELLETYRPEQIAIVAPSVNSSDYGCPRLAAMLADRLGITLYTTHKQRADVSDDLLKGKLLVSTYHQSKGDEREAVIVLGVDARQYRQDGYPVRDDSPVVRNALHVACTRARRQLVLFHEHTVPAYPTIDLEALQEVAEVRVACPYEPRPLDPLSFDMIERRTNWMVNFASEQTLERMETMMHVQEPITLGAPVTARPVNTVHTEAGTIEDVSCYFPRAILAAVERQRLLETVPGTRTQCQMETQVRCSRRCRQGVPPAYSGILQDVLDHKPPAGCHSWMMLSVLHNTLVRHNFRHELRQMQDFSWLGPDEVAYFRGCTDSLLNVTRRHTAFDFNNDAKRVCQVMKTRVRGTVPYCSVEDNSYTPWQFSFSPEPTEADFLELLTSMWFMYSRYGRIFCIAKNTLYRVSVESDAVLSEFVEGILKLKREHELATVATASE